MVCKICGYESNENFSVCPYCGEETSLQRQNSFTEQNQNNQYNTSQYETPFTKPNPQNNQYNQSNLYNNNYNSNPENNYQNQPYRPVARRYKNYSSNMPEYFREGWGTSFEITQNELRMERFLNGGDFMLWSIVVLVVSIFFVVFLPLPFSFIMPKIFSVFPFFFIFLFVFMIISSIYLTHAKIKVNSNGITIKTVLKEYFIPKEKIDSLVSRTVRRAKGRYGSETFCDLFIIMKDRSISNKTDLDTGLCYKNQIHVDYLIDTFNEHLGFL